MNSLGRLGSIALLCFLYSCSTVTQDAAKQNELFSADVVLSEDSAADTPSPSDAGTSVNADGADSTSDSTAIDYRTLPDFGGVADSQQFDPIQMPSFPAGEISALIAPQPVPDFIDTVFGELLGLGYRLDPGVAERSEIVTYRTPSSTTRDKLYVSAGKTLLDYGVAIQYEDGEIRAVLRDDLLRQAPIFIRSRARGSVPSNLRPIAQYIELRSLRVGTASSILKEIYPSNDDVKIYSMDQFNAMIITGLPEFIDHAERIIAQIDRVRFVDSRIATVNVSNWELAQLTEVVEQQLSIEGFAVTSNPQFVRSINLFPIEFTNQLVIFAEDPTVLDYAVETVRRLDASAKIAKDVQAFIYKARYYEATTLANILNGRAPGQSSNQPNITAGNAAIPNSPNGQTPSGFSGGLQGGAFDVNFTVDQQGNRLIYMATEEQNREIRSLLRLLDTPQDEVLIDVTIAEVTLTDDTSYGLDFLMSQIGSQGYSIGVGTGGGIGLTAGGLSGQYASGDYTINFSALSSNNQINVLSSPRLVVKSGSTGAIQVGTDVPIITSQSAASTQIGGNTDILQTVQYRETGILLDIQPLVLSNDRIDMKVSQEVSSAEDNANQAIASPVISNRKISTELTLQDGQSAILGGLIENRYTRGTTGVPIAKDVPLLGNLFKTETLNSTRTMLLVMITPYVLSTRDDRRSSVGALADAMNEAFENQVDESVTLTKPNEPFKIDID